MHLTYHEKGRHTSNALSKADEAGALESSYGDFFVGEALPSGDMSSPASDPLKEALEGAYYDWWGDNYHSLDVGMPGDVLDLRDKLNAAFAKASNSGRDTAPTAMRNASPADSNSVT